MSVLIRPPRTRQPQGPTGGSAVARIAYNSATRQDERGNASVLVGAPDSVITGYGSASRLDTTGKYVSITPRAQAFAGSFCLLMAFKQSGAVNNGGTLVNLAGTSGNNNKIDIYTLSSGAVRADVYSSVGVATTADTAASAVVTGGEYILALVNDLGAGTLSWWVNGQPSGASAATVSRSGESASVLFGGPGAGAAPNIDLAGVFVLPTAAGAQSYRRNPWQLFTPPARRVWGVASSGGTTITASVGAASAVGVSAHVDRTLNAGPAAASATGVTARLPRVIGTTPGAAAAAGLTAQLNRIFGTTTANAIAAGVTALVNNASATVGRPASDTSNSGWTASTGSDLFAMLDEITPSATDYIVATATGAVCELALNTTSYPGTASQVLKFRASSSTGNSVIVRLKNTGGATVRSATQLLTGTDTEYSIVLTAPEIAAITSGDLSVELESA